MNNQIIFVVLAVVVLVVTIAFVYLSVRKSTSDRSQSMKDGRSSGSAVSSDFRSKKIKCARCGGNAYGVLGTENTYRCSACGYKSTVGADEV